LIAIKSLCFRLVFTSTFAVFGNEVLKRSEDAGACQTV
jgi:hypothetical protein